MKLLDDQFKDKEEDKVRKAYKNWKVCEKKEDITFAEYGSRMTILFRELEAADIKFGKKAKAHILIAESGISEEEKFKMERLVKDAPDDEKEKLIKNNLIRFYDGRKKDENEECAYFAKQETSRGRGTKRGGSQRGRGSSSNSALPESGPRRESATTAARLTT